MSTNREKKPTNKKNGKKAPNKKTGIAVLFSTAPLAIVTISVAVLLVLAIGFGAAVGTVMIVKNATAVISYGTETMDKGVAAYFISRFKATYITSVQREGNSFAGDYDEFWQSEYEPGLTHGERFEDEAKDYLKQILVAARLYDASASLTREDKEIIKKTYTEVLEYQANGDKKKFNEMGAKYGFDYGDFKKAVKMLYKATQAYGVLYGNNGGILTDEEKDAYINEYTRVRLLFIRTEDKLVTNKDTGEVTVEPLSAEEKIARQQTISELRAAIEALHQGTDGQMNEDVFAAYQKEKGEGDGALDSYGYYFHPNAECTAEFRDEFPEIVDKAYEMKVGDFAEVKVSIGYCYIYRCPVISGAYVIDELERWFSDFFTDASVFSYSEMITENAGAVKEKRKLSKIDFVGTPMNVEIKVVGFGE